MIINVNDLAWAVEELKKNNVECVFWSLMCYDDAGNPMIKLGQFPDCCFDKGFTVQLFQPEKFPDYHDFDENDLPY